MTEVDGMSIDVSYVVPAYAAEEHISRAVHSALDQRGVSTEVVVVDDASPDATAQIVAKLADSDARVKLVSLDRNGGPSRARNAGIAVARGRWVGVLDADDALEPDRTAHLLDLARACGAQIVSDNLLCVDVDGCQTPAFPEGSEPYSFVMEPAPYLVDNIVMSGGRASGYLKPIFHRSLLGGGASGEAVLYDEDVRIGEDFLFCLEAMLCGGLYLISSRPGYLYSRRPGSLSHRIGPESIERLQEGAKRLRSRRKALLDANTEEAIETYRIGLERAGWFLSTAQQASTGAYGSALRSAARHPSSWPLVARYGWEAISKRVRRRAAQA